MKILNLYAGIGGNRKLWGDEHEITAVELNESIAKIYQDFFPNDTVIVADAHQYLLDHYKEFDFIWSSPPCPSHSEIRRCGTYKGQYSAIYPDMALYQEIILLKYYAPKDSKWVVENVKPFYTALIDPSFIIDRHYFWSNYTVREPSFKSGRTHHNIKSGKSEVYGFYIGDYETSKRKDTILRNMVDPKVGEYILNMATGAIPPIQEGLFK